MHGNEFLDRHRRFAGDSRDDLVCAGEEAVLIVDGDGAEMLDQELGQAKLLEALSILRDGHWLIADLSAEHFADRFGDARLVELGRSMERIGVTSRKGPLRTLRRRDR
jgi:hypothetical protein